METPLYKQIYNYVLEEIKTGHIKPGERVPSEKELADLFKVSRITSKKALENLTHTHLIERSRGKGSFVSKDLPNLNSLGIDELTEEANKSDGGNNSDRPLVGLLLEDFSSSYGLRLLQAMEKRVAEQGGYLLLKRSYGSREEEEKAIREFQAIGVDGMLVFPVHGSFYNASLLRMVLDNSPLVLVDRYLKGIASCAVYTNNQQAAEELTEYLIDRGHQEIAFLSAGANTSSIEERAQGFANALNRRGLKLKAQHSFNQLYSTLPEGWLHDNIETDQLALQNFVESQAELTAFLCTEYNIALLLEKVLRRLNRQVPEAASIVCFDSPYDPLKEAFFTHIQQNEEEMGRKAVDLLLSQLKHEPVQTHNVIPHQLIEGRSVGQRVSFQAKIGV